jgi:hypothetical protein
MFTINMHLNACTVYHAKFGDPKQILISNYWPFPTLIDGTLMPALDLMKQFADIEGEICLPIWRRNFSP